MTDPIIFAEEYFELKYAIYKTGATSVSELFYYKWCDICKEIREHKGLNEFEAHL
jgi:hypothetical protein